MSGARPAIHAARAAFAIPILLVLAARGSICGPPLASPPATATATVEFSVQASASVTESPPRIDLEWAADPWAPHYVVYRRRPDDPGVDWGAPLATLPGDATTFSDHDVRVGERYEYGIYKSPGVVRDTVRVAAGAALTFTIHDRYGDGICCDMGQGTYVVRGCGEVLASGGEFGTSESTTFVAGGFGIAGDAGAPCTEVTIEIRLDVTAVETTWELVDDASGAVLAGGGPYEAPKYGHVLAGIRCPAIEDRGAVLLVVDASIAPGLAPALDQLELDLIGDGYRVHRRDVARDAAVVTVKQEIVAACAADPSIDALFVLGHVPVPYSGDNRAFHSDHFGAWPADVYYGDLDGVWTDATVNSATSTRPANHNIPGDGKFDQTFLPSDVELAVGRVDLHDLPSFQDDETWMLWRYLQKNHAYRTGTLVATPRGLVDDHFGASIGGAYAATGWRNFAALLGAPNVHAAPFFATLEHDSHLWAYACGPGSYTSAAGVGRTDDFARRPVRAVFTALFGSYFGDWDSTDNFLRAPLASENAALVSFWGGAPAWHLHRMALGETIGQAARLTQNNRRLYGASRSERQVHAALMGDPTLRLHVVRPVADVAADSTAVGQVRVRWTASPDTVLGYHVDRAADLRGRFTRLTGQPVGAVAFVDEAPLLGSNVYMVRALVLEQGASGSYFNLSTGVIDSTSMGELRRPPVALELAPGAPNPFTEATSIRFTLPEAAPAALRIYDVQGRLRCALLEAPRVAAGPTVVRWDGTDANGRRLPAGAYFYRLETPGRAVTRKLILVD